MNMPWMKLPHRQYMVSVTRAALKPVERLAFIELSMFANTQPNRQLPDLDDALAGWAGMGVKQWAKIKARVFAEWSLNNGYWSLPTWFDLYDDAPKAQAETAPNDTTASDLSAKRSAAAKARWNAKSANAMQNDHEKSMQNDANVNFAYANGGIKGGDLDQDLDLDKDLEKSESVKKSSACITDPTNFTRHTLAQTGFSVLEIPTQFSKLAKQRNTQLLDADLNVIWSRLMDWSSKDEQADVKRNWLNTWIARINSDGATTIANRLKYQDAHSKAPKHSAGAVNHKFPEAQYTIPPSPETLASVKKMQDEMEDFV